MKDPQDSISVNQNEGERVCFVSMEVIDPIFSGNGVGSRSFARGILSRDSTSLMVLCAQHKKKSLIEPAERVDDAVLKALFGSEGTNDKVKARLTGVAVTVSKWGVTDRGSAWEEYGDGMTGPLVRDSLEAFKPTVFICVDWTASKAVQRIRAAGLLKHAENNRRIPEVYACFCAFHALYNTNEEDRLFYCEAEAAAMQAASLSTTLSHLDAEKLAALSPSAPPADVLLPPLRPDIAALVTPGSARRGWGAGGGGERRKYITCCLRVTQAKNVKVFCQAMALLAPELQTGGYVPFLCGSGLGPTGPGAEVSAYARECKEILLETCPWAAVHEEFLTPAELLEVLSRAALNVHPAPYEAYGMTIVEAAAAGTPTMIHEDWHNIGASQLLPPASAPQADARGGAVLCCDTTDAADLAAAISRALASLPDLAHTAQIAQERALRWGEGPFGEAMCELIDRAVQGVRDVPRL